MPTPIEQLLSRTVYATDGTTTIWDFSFEDGYLDPTHVKAYTTNATGARVDLTILPEYLIGEFQLQITPALAADLELTIYRDTPKNAPLVDFTDESSFSEVALDTNARQAIMVAAEAIDVVNTSDVQAAVAAAETAGNAAAASAIDAATAAASAGAASVAAAAADASAIDAANSAALINPANFATSAQGAKADTALQPGAIGVTVASQANGALAATALQPASIGSSVQGYDAATAKTNQSQQFTAAPYTAPLTDNDLSFDISSKVDFVCTPTAGGVLTFTGIRAGAKGELLLVNTSNYAITKAATVKATSSFLGTISATGRYRLAYSCLDGTNVDITTSGALA
jgi:hypothetical protein